MKPDKDRVKIKLCRDPMSEKSNINELKMALVENGAPEEFFLFVQNFQTDLEASGTLVASEKIQYLCTILRGKALPQLGMFSVQVGSTTIAHLNHIILRLGTYIFTVNALSK